MIDLHRHKQPNCPTPPTYNQGTTTIDTCLGTSIFVQALQAAWYLPFGCPSLLPGDHRLLGMAFNMDILFGHKLPDPNTPQYRGVHSNTETTVKRFSKMVVEGFLKHDLFDKIYALAAKGDFTSEDHNNLEGIDKNITTIILKANKQCRRLNQAPWSVELHHAYLIHHYWVLQLSKQQTGQNLQTACEAILAALPNPIDTTGSISKNITLSRTKLREIKRKAVQKRKDFLQSLILAANTAGNKSKGNLIRHLMQAKQNHRCFTIIKNYLKPRMPGGLTHLLVPDNTPTGEWKTLYQPEEIEAAMHTQCQNHFKQAHRPPYTVPPLTNLLGTNSLTEFGNQLLQGTTNLDTLNISPHTKLLLQQHRRKYPKYNLCRASGSGQNARRHHHPVDTWVHINHC